MQMRPVRSHRLTLLAAGVLLASPLLAGCGFNYQTDRVNTISAGINDREGEVDVLGAVVIAGEDDLGLFVATLVDGDSEEPATLERLEPTDEVEPIEADAGIDVPAGGRTSLFDTGGIPVTGSFKAGQFVSVTLSFDTGQSTTVEIPVVTPCRQYSPDKLTELTLPTSATGSEGAGAVEDAETTEEPSEPSESAEDTEESHSSESTETESDPYSCEPATPVEHGGGHGE